MTAVMLLKFVSMVVVKKNAMVEGIRMDKSFWDDNGLYLSQVIMIDIYISSCRDAIIYHGASKPPTVTGNFKDQK